MREGVTGVVFKSFSSGSCGNCYLLASVVAGDIQEAILIDAGVSLRRVRKELAAEGIDISSISAILVTHDHMDHIRSLGSYCKYLHLPVWATDVLHNAMANHTYTLEHLSGVRRDLKADAWNEILPSGLSARYFVVPHDATQTVGYGIRIAGLKFVIMTDLGAMTPEAMSFAANADVVVIESNYDMDMLMGGPYTHELKMRICQGGGHLSNDLCAASIAKFWHPGLRHIYLCHLSENNNTPELAYKASCESLKSIGFAPTHEKSSLFERSDGQSVTLSALPRRTPSNLFIL